MSAIIPEGYSRPPHSPALNTPPTTGEQVLRPPSEDGDDPVSELEDPFADTAPPHRYRIKSPPPPKWAHTPSFAAYMQANGGRENKFRPTALAEKSTNYPILINSAITTVAAYDPAAVDTTFLHPSKRETHPSPKLHPRKKLRLDSQDTPRLIIKVEPPRRPWKPRQVGLTLEDQDFPSILSPTKARKPDSKGHLRRYSGISENGSNRPYNKPPTLLGITSTEMSDNVSTVAGAWVRERAKEMFSGTRKAAKRILEVSPSSARYKHQRHKEEPRLGGMVKIRVKSDFAVVINSQKSQKEEIGYAAACYTPASRAIESGNKDAISLKDFLQDPFLSPDDCEVAQDMDSEEDEDCLPEALKNPGSSQTPHQRSLRRTESAQDLLMLGSAKMRHAGRGIIKRSSKSRLRTEEDGTWDSLSSFLATTNLSPGGAYEFPHLLSDNEMPSSSPIFKSTPKKDWYRSGDSDTTNTLQWRNSHQSNHKEQSHAKAMIIAFGSSDTDCIEDIATGELFNGGNLYVGRSRDKEYAGPPSKFSGSLAVMSAGRVFNIDEGGKTLNTTVAITTKTNNGSLEEEAKQRQKRQSGIHVGGSRTGRLVSKDTKFIMELSGAEGISTSHNDGGSNRAATSRVTSKGTAVGGTSRGAVKKGIRRRTSFRGYGRINMDDDIDELQMDFPAAII